MRATPWLTDGERLTALAAWLDHASRWLEREVRDSRASRPTEEEADPAQRVETVMFLTAELDAMVDGLRRATDVLAALATPLPGPIVPDCSLPHIPAGQLRGRGRTRAKARAVRRVLSGA